MTNNHSTGASCSITKDQFQKQLNTKLVELTNKLQKVTCCNQFYRSTIHALASEHWDEESDSFLYGIHCTHQLLDQSEQSLKQQLKEISTWIKQTH